MKIMGNPGDYASQLAFGAGLRRISYLGLAGVALLAGMLAVLVAKWPPLPSLGASVVVAVFAYAASTSAAKSQGAASIGAKKERETAAILAGCGIDGVAVFGLQLGKHHGSRADTDVVVALPSGALFIIEVKTGFGRISIAEGGRLRVGKRVIPGDPVAQVLREKRDADVCLQTGFTRPVVVISDASESSVTINGVDVISAQSLPDWIRSSARSAAGTAGAVETLKKLAKKQRKRAYRPR